MFKSFTRSALIASMAVLVSSSAHAAPFGTLTFDTPYAVVSPTDSIDVWVTFTLDASSANLVLNSGDEIANGTLDQEDIPVNWLSYSVSFLNTYIACDSTFLNVCSPAAYRFDFNVGTPAPADSIPAGYTYSLLAGESLSYKFGTFVPEGGFAPPGIYRLFGSGLTLNLLGTAQKLDVNGDPLVYAAGDSLLDLYGNVVYDMNGDAVIATAGDPVIESVLHSITLADTYDSNIVFVRVVPVPEPSTYVMLLAGLGLVGFAARRRLR